MCYCQTCFWLFIIGKTEQTGPIRFDNLIVTSSDPALTEDIQDLFRQAARAPLLLSLQNHVKEGMKHMGCFLPIYPFLLSALQVLYITPIRSISHLLRSEVVAPASKSQPQPCVIQITNSTLRQKHLNRPLNPVTSKWPTQPSGNSSRYILSE